MKRNEIRIVDPSKEVWETINKLAKEEKRTIGKQAEYIIEKYIKDKKNNANL